MANAADRVSKMKWVYISAGAFVLFFLFAVFLLVFADRIGQFGITKSFYYILLIPVGLCASAFLFGALHSHAKYVGTNPYGKIILTGPVVVFALVVIGGFYFATPDSTFSLTIRLSDPKGRTIEDGSVLLELGSQQVRRNIGENGEVIFADIPSLYLDKNVKVIPQVEGYVSDNKSLKIPPDKVINIQLISENYKSEIRGSVIDNDGNPLKGVKLNFESGLVVSETNEDGNFTASVPFKSGTSVLITATLNDRTGFRDYVAIPSSGSITISFKR